jgi:tetratricopeptide (TPR) repeat protein
MSTRPDVPSLARLEHEIGLRLGQGDLLGAARAAAVCRTAWPSSPSGWLYGSMVVLLADDKVGALAIIEEGLASHPSNVQCLLQKAEVLLAMGRREESLGAVTAAAANAGDVVPALGALADFLTYAREHTRALAILDRAVAAAPSDPAMLLKRAAVRRYVGDFERSGLDYEEVLRLTPGDTEALKSLSELARQTPEHNHIAATEDALRRAPAGSHDAGSLRFALAKSCEDLGEHERSWEHLVAGNRIEHSLARYDSALDEAAIGQLLASFPDVEGAWPDTTAEAPIFIVGLPRSGTTLVERIIGSHSQVHGAGELAAWTESQNAAAQRLGTMRPSDWISYASALAALDPALVAREYLARTRAWRGTRTRFCDKQTLNFFHCAVILRAFPQARILHVTRHPLASCYSLYKARFPPGTFRFCYDLKDLGDFYIRYRRVMDHWHRILPGRILDVAYEDVVKALAPTTRRMLDYAGLPFEEACLAFHLNPAAATTSSSVQARQPLYESSLEQWRHHEGGLAPLRSQLEAAGILTS